MTTLDKLATSYRDGKRRCVEPEVSSHRNGSAFLNAEEWQRVAGRLTLSPREFELVQNMFEGKKLEAIAST